MRTDLDQDSGQIDGVGKGVLYGSDSDRGTVSKGMLWGGRILSTLPAIVLFRSASRKLFQPTGYAEGLSDTGWNPETMFYIGIVEIACTVIYLIPRTAVLGAILLAAYMGGAVATHVRIGDPFYNQILIGVFVWGGLFLRDPRIRDLIPIRSK